MSIARKITAKPVQVLANSNTRKNPQRGHVMPRHPIIDINSPGRLRSRHVLALCGLSHSTMYSRMKAGTFPAPDGKDGGLNFWNTHTIRSYLQAETTRGCSK
jgi:predicted DNA-binding transcriptional regulator AlpA